MNDTMKSKISKEASPKMTLDTALKTIEASNALLKEERSGLWLLYDGKILTLDDILEPGLKKVAVATIASSAGGLTALYMGVDMSLVFILPGLCVASFVGMLVSPHIIGKFFSRRKYKEYEDQLESDAIFSELAYEEFHQKEQQILKDCKPALDFANEELKDQGYSIIYGSSGFNIESTEPLEINQWDALRLKAIRNKGSKAIGVHPKMKELAS